MGLWTPTEQRREQIVEAALGLLATRSLEAVTTREVAKALHLSQPALFRHFRSREALLLAVAERARADLEQTVAAVLARRTSALEQLGALALALLEHVERAPGLPRLLFGAPGPAGPVQDALRRILSMQRTLAAELVRQGQREGAVAPDVSADAAATLFVGVLQALVLQWELDGRPVGLSARLPPCLAVWERGLGHARAGRSDAADDAPAPASRTSRAAVTGRAAGLAHAAVSSRAAAPAHATTNALRLLDVRPILAGGVDPLAHILEALGALPTAGVLAVLAPFRPAPLVALLEGRGHSVQVEGLDGHRFLLLAVVDGAPAIDDLRELEPPAPLERVLTAAANLSAGARYLGRTPRSPRLLGQRLHDRGVRFELLDLPDGSALVRLTGTASA